MYAFEFEQIQGQLERKARPEHNDQYRESLINYILALKLFMASIYAFILILIASSILLIEPLLRDIDFIVTFCSYIGLITATFIIVGIALHRLNPLTNKKQHVQKVNT